MLLSCEPCAGSVSLVERGKIEVQLCHWLCSCLPHQIATFLIWHHDFLSQGNARQTSLQKNGVDLCYSKAKVKIITQGNSKGSGYNFSSSVDSSCLDKTNGWHRGSFKHLYRHDRGVAQIGKDELWPQTSSFENCRSVLLCSHSGKTRPTKTKHLPSLSL